MLSTISGLQKLSKTFEQEISQDKEKATVLTEGNKNDPKEKSSLPGFDSLKELVLLLTNIDARKPQMLKGFVRPTQGPKKEPIYISALFIDDEEEAYVELLHEFKDVFAWPYKDMPGLDPKVAVHQLSIRKGAPPVKQAQRRFRPELVPLIEIEVNKLIEVGFIREVKYLKWISSSVLMRKKNGQIRGVPFEWDEACRNAFRNIKSYLMKPPVLVAPVPGRPLILYIAAHEYSVGALLAQENDEGKEKIKALLLSTYCTTCLESKFTKKAVKEQVLADFLADHLIPTEWELSNDLPDENVLVIEVTPHWNIVWDSKLVINHLLGLYEVKRPKLFSYLNYAQRLIGWLGDVEIEHVPRKDNKQADALAKLASTLTTLED
ncbi:hypothetical protein Sango_2835600 [Sesamum angolense]|uniref:Reverse transcriptase/retrotransposon-derived protein RNase H-like domain-containing protein n=1 Tax=Sesamum angolense TaxID=2727404 RepID=A0AAE1T6I1_9LAMI|nr:hypothetical protein Sango_2835600 [Sesamum angolense]